MINAKYLMITHWDNYWDKVNNTYYPKGMLKGVKENELEENAPTIFIKLDKNTKKYERAWFGYVSNFKNKEEKIYFDVKIEKEISLNDLPRHLLKKSEGWYLIIEKVIPIEKEELTPPLFRRLEEIEDSKLFEKYVYYLLKLIGINNCYSIEKQKGNPDGFFVLKKLAVIYDCTLEKNFERTKKTQIENYRFQLTRDEFQIPNTNIRYQIKDCEKEVWIITKDKDKSKVIEDYRDVKIKKISIRDLFDIYYERLLEDYDEEKLIKKLTNLGI
ncbi:MAG: hypothetical protein N2323_02270 [candidate division WOR-3 bacterium]|nr:hypothetical protein [candidate division WOR-3 bacterium]MCX7836773.1 hypothetical protein [candidate division WOR-3 bacterium]MDW8113589.1 hypothetical protein [candidate division WOR-3 bacterium]